MFRLGLLTMAALVVACGPSRGDRDRDEDGTEETDGGATTPDGGDTTRDGGGGPGAHLRFCVDGDAGSSLSCVNAGADPVFVPTIDFGSVARGTTASRRILLSNDGDETLVLSTFALDTSGFFSLSGVPEILASGAEAAVVVTFSPADEGPSFATLQVASNDPLLSRFAVHVQGQGVGGGAGRLCVEPSEVAFGDVVVNTVAERELVLSNCGSAAITLTSYEAIAADATAAQFSYVAAAPPLTLGAGDSYVVVLRYKPLRGGSAAGAFSLQTSVGSANVPLSGRGLGGSTCAADLRAGAGSSTVTPGTLVVFDATGSTGAPPLSYQWAVTQRPSASSDTLAFPETGKARLVPSVDGAYSVQVTITDGFGCTANATRSITVAGGTPPTGRVWVELTWGVHSDFDLHYVGPGGTLFSTSSDVHYGALRPDWGLSNTTSADGNPSNDAVMDMDALWGNGPEVIRHDAPFAATYDVWVHDFCDRQSSTGGPAMGAMEAIVKVFVDGTLRVTRRLSLTKGDLWNAARVVVTASGSITVSEPTAAPHKAPADKSCSP